MKQWMTCAYIRMDSQIKDKIFDFAVTLVRSNDTSVRMKDPATELMSASGQPVRSTPTRLLFICPTYSWLHQAKIPSSSFVFSQTTPRRPADGREIAIGLMLCESDHFSRIITSDFIYHLRGQPEIHIHAASDLNNRIVNWVKRSVLCTSDLYDRSKLVGLMIYAAKVGQCCPL